MQRDEIDQRTFAQRTHTKSQTIENDGIQGIAETIIELRSELEKTWKIKNQRFKKLRENELQENLKVFRDAFAV